MQARSVITLGTLATGLLLTRPAAAHGDYGTIALIAPRAGSWRLRTWASTCPLTSNGARARAVVGSVVLGSRYSTDGPFDVESPHRVVFGGGLSIGRWRRSAWPVSATAARRAGYLAGAGVGFSGAGVSVVGPRSASSSRAATTTFARRCTCSSAAKSRSTPTPSGDTPRPSCFGSSLL